MNIGFSTGSLALGDFKKAIKMLEGKSVNAIELSSLREEELPQLIAHIDYLDLKKYNHISFHAPSKLVHLNERELVHILLQVAAKKWSIIIHPDIISDPKEWRILGQYLCIENMDKRKPIGRTTKDLEEIFDNLPEASFCLDIAHAKQIDPTMMEAYLMLKKFERRLKQIHVSDVNSQSNHESLNFDALFAYKKISSIIPKDIPIILESPVTENKINLEIKLASLIFENKEFLKFIDKSSIDFNPYSQIIKQSRDLELV
ncbi:MAG: hypothetical protein H7282_17945 [Cytophagaceae bacterium]|nr:hypothetical protein [Cytophagaceae bacterium]